MSEEEKAIEFLKNFIKNLCNFKDAEMENTELVKNLKIIDNIVEKQDKIIYKMGKAIYRMDTVSEYGFNTEEIIEYFTNKIEKENNNDN